MMVSIARSKLATYNMSQQTLKPIERKTKKRHSRLVLYSSLLLLSVVLIIAGYLLLQYPRNSSSILQDIGFQHAVGKIKICFLNALASIFPQSSKLDQADKRIPFWILGHMVNSIDQIEPMISNGTNGIEVDISFDDNGIPIESYHGFPCDCGRFCNYRSSFGKLLKYLGNKTSEDLQLVLFDLKLGNLSDESKLVAGETLARLLHENIYSTNTDQQARIRFVISINHVRDRGLIKAFAWYMEANGLMHIMHKYIGFDVGMNDKLDDIISMWQHLHSSLTTRFNIWQGDGLTNCLNYARSTDRLAEAIALRNNDHFSKIYFWTVDMQYQFREILRSVAPDAVLTNHPQRIRSVLEESEFRQKYRLATSKDNPFERSQAAVELRTSSGRLMLLTDTLGVIWHPFTSLGRQLTSGMSKVCWFCY